MKSGQIPGLVIGTVTAVDDPLKEGRIRVTFPWLDDTVESDWIPVVAPFAGADRGLYMMPEQGDEMVIGFLHGDFNRPVVLGAMWNGQSEAPSPDPRQRMIRSKNGHTIRFVDSTPVGKNKGALFIEDAHGNILVMTENLTKIIANPTLHLIAPNVYINDRRVRDIDREI